MQTIQTAFYIVLAVLFLIGLPIMLVWSMVVVSVKLRTIELGFSLIW
jgi:hypothetical protein